MVMSDLDELVVPFPEHLLVNLNESKDLVRATFQSLPSMFAHAQTTKSCLGSALKAAKAILDMVGGKIIVFQCSIPNCGDGAIDRKEDQSLKCAPNSELIHTHPVFRGTPKELSQLEPFSDFYKQVSVCESQTVDVH